VVSLNISIKFWFQKLRAYTLPIFAWWKKKNISQEEVDKKLVYSFSTRKLPSKEQLRHLNKFLNPREFLIVKICALIVVVGLAYYAYTLINSHLQVVPASGGTYSEGLIGYPRTINPLYIASRDADADLSRLIYSSLYQYDVDGRLVADLADNLTISEDGKEYTIRIKDGVTWHNGERLTADDVVFTVETIQNAAFHSPLRSALSVAVIEKIDDLTLKFKLNEAFSPFTDLLTFGIMPKRLWEGVTPDGALISDLNLKPIGSGPYRFTSLVRSSTGDIKEYTITANTAYYGGAPFLETLNFKFYPNYEEAVKALNSKQISGLSYLPWGWREDILAQNSLNFFELNQPRLVSLFFNQTKNTALANKDNRIALAQALDKKAVVDSVLSSAYQLADGPLPASSWGYSDTVTRYTYNLELAKEKLSVGPVSVVVTVVDSGANATLAEEIKRYWEEAGAKVEIRLVSGEQAAEIIKNRDFEILLYGQSVGGDPDVYAFWHSSQVGSNGLNLSSYNSPEVDKLLTEARTDNTVDGRLDKYRKFQEIVSGDLPAIFLYSPAYTYIQGNKLKGFNGRTVINPADRFSGVSNWYLKTDRRLVW
jgi:peptide/nickel transport system substrate-binding protein